MPCHSPLLSSLQWRGAGLPCFLLVPWQGALLWGGPHCSPPKQWRTSSHPTLWCQWAGADTFRKEWWKERIVSGKSKQIACIPTMTTAPYAAPGNQWFPILVFDAPPRNVIASPSKEGGLDYHLVLLRALVFLQRMRGFTFVLCATLSCAIFAFQTLESGSGWNGHFKAICYRVQFLSAILALRVRATVVGFLADCHLA